MLYVLASGLSLPPLPSLATRNHFLQFNVLLSSLWIYPSLKPFVYSWSVSPIRKWDLWQEKLCTILACFQSQEIYLNRRWLFPAHFKNSHQQLPFQTVIFKLISFCGGHILVKQKQTSFKRMKYNCVSLVITMFKKVSERLILYPI